VGGRWGVGAASVALAVALLAIGAFRSDDDHELRYFLIASAIAVAAAAIVFLLIVPRIRRAGLGSLIIGIIAVASIALFWLGLPSVFAGAAAALGTPARAEGSERGKATAGLVLAAFAVAAAVVLAFVG
jgi:hypothetical protein